MGHTIYKNADNPVLGVLFDMDGVVLDTEKLYARFWAEAAHALGYPMTYEQALGMRSLNGDAGQAKLESYFGPGVSRKVMRDKRVELMDAFVEEHGVEAKPGVSQLLDYLKGQGIRVAIATSSPLARAKKYLDGLGLTEKFDCICSGHDVAHGKPEPDIYLHAAACIGVKPENCLAIEDSPAGIESAYRAGCMPVLVPDLDGSDEAMRKILFAEADSLEDVAALCKVGNRRNRMACYDALPDADAALEVWPGGNNGESCLCVYGVTDAEVTSWFLTVNARAEELAQNALEVTVKPLLWVDSRETALEFMEFANGMEEADFCELILELQRSYNTPWTSAQQLDKDMIQRIAENWERRQCSDRR